MHSSASRLASWRKRNAKMRAKPGYLQWERLMRCCREEAAATGRAVSEVRAEWRVPSWPRYLEEGRKQGGWRWRMVDYSQHDIVEP